jgi:hypothetical protein
VQLSGLAIDFMISEYFSSEIPSLKKPLTTSARSSLIFTSTVSIALQSLPTVLKMLPDDVEASASLTLLSLLVFFVS